jgi:hypothetical protein
MGNGDGTVDFTGTTFEGVSVTFAEPGLYYPSVTVSEPNQTVRSATTLVHGSTRRDADDEVELHEKRLTERQYGGGGGLHSEE